MAGFRTPLSSGTGQDPNAFLDSSESISSGNSTYNYPSQSPYEQFSQNFSAYPGTYIPNQYNDDEDTPEHLQMAAARYPYGVPLLSNNPSPRHPLTQSSPYAFPHITQNAPLQSLHYANHHDHYQADEVEGQESVNESTMLSEPVIPPVEGFPDIREFDDLVSW